MAKSADAFRTISEVADWLETPAHVLRFWESKFSQVKPVKRAGGRRYYRPQDMQLLGGIKKLLHDDGMTIKAVQKMLRQDGIRHVAALSKDLPPGMAAPAAKPAKPPKPSPPPAAEPAPMAPALAPEPVTDPAPPSTQTVSEPQPDMVAEDIAKTVDQRPEPEPSAVNTQAAPKDTSEPEPELPMFASQPQTDHPAEGAPDAAASESPQEMAEDSPAPTLLPDLHVDVPADPSDDMGLSHGVLGRIITLPRPLSAAQATELRPVMTRLQALLEKVD